MPPPETPASSFLWCWVRSFLKRTKGDLGGQGAPLFILLTGCCGHPEDVLLVCCVVVFVDRDALSLVRLYATQSRARCYVFRITWVTSSILFFAASCFESLSSGDDLTTRRRAKPYLPSRPASVQANARHYVHLNYRSLSGLSASVRLGYIATHVY